MSAGCLGVSERCLGDDRVVSWCLGGVRWCLGGVLDTFFRSGHFRPPPGHTGIQDPGSDRVKLSIQEYCLIT